MVIYKCACMSREAEVALEPRRDGEPIMLFVDRMGHAVAEDHRLRSPHCRSGRAEYIKLPIDPEGVVGREGRVN